MGSQRSEIDEQFSSGSTPEDVAALYAWANIHGAKYRDYSASRREQRAQVRYAAAKAVLESESKAQPEADAAADAAKREERELAQAHASATQQALVYQEADALLKRLAGPQPRPSLTQEVPTTTVAAETSPQSQPEPEAVTPMVPTPPPVKTGTWKPLSEEILATENGSQPDNGNLSIPPARPLNPDSYVIADPARPAWLASTQPTDSIDTAASAPEPEAKTEVAAEPAEDAIPLEVSTPSPPETDAAPVLESSAASAQEADNTPTLETAVPSQPLLPSAPESAIETAPHEAETSLPILTVFSPVAGVGATSVLAGVAAALAEAGEKIALVDTAPSAPLALHLGGKPLAPGLVRTYWLPESTAKPISLLGFNAADVAEDEAARLFSERISATTAGAQRILLDLSADSIGLLRPLVHLQPVVLIPLAPTMVSLQHVDACETLFTSIAEPGKPLSVYYVINRFDAASPLHQYLYTRLRSALGHRVLQRSITSASAVSEALSEGTTVLELAPHSEIAEQFRNLAALLKVMSPARAAGAGKP